MVLLISVIAALGPNMPKPSNPQKKRPGQHRRDKHITRQGLTKHRRKVESLAIASSAQVQSFASLGVGRLLHYQVLLTYVHEYLVLRSSFDLVSLLYIP